MISFVVHGIPAPQGSKTPWGTEANARTKPWRATVSAEAASVAPADVLTGPLIVHLCLYFPRPKAHYGTGRNAAVLKPAAPKWHATKPDGDKLARACLDACTGILWRDDSQVASLRVHKLYGSPRAEIKVWTMAEAGYDLEDAA